jgi:hypothetical protein
MSMIVALPVEVVSFANLRAATTFQGLSGCHCLNTDHAGALHSTSPQGVLPTRTAASRPHDGVQARPGKGRNRLSLPPVHSELFGGALL